MTVGQGPTALAVGVGGGVWRFLLSSIVSLLFLPFSGGGGGSGGGRVVLWCLVNFQCRGILQFGLQ